MTRVSVQVPVRDAEAYIGEALDSVLAQVGPHDEVIVIDDGSTDATPGILADYGDRIRVLRQGPLGLSAARNRGLEASVGELLAFLDSDDRWRPGALDTLVRELAEHPEAVAVLGRTDEFLDPGVKDAAAAGLRAPVVGRRGFFLGAMVARRAVFDAVCFDETQPLAITTDWLGRARDAGIVIDEVDVVTLDRRIRPGSMTTDADAYQKALLSSLRSGLQRRRPS